MNQNQHQLNVNEEGDQKSGVSMDLPVQISSYDSTFLDPNECSKLKNYSVDTLHAAVLDIANAFLGAQQCISLHQISTNILKDKFKCVRGAVNILITAASRYLTSRMKYEIYEIPKEVSLSINETEKNESEKKNSSASREYSLRNSLSDPDKLQAVNSSRHSTDDTVIINQRKCSRGLLLLILACLQCTQKGIVSERFLFEKLNTVDSILFEKSDEEPLDGSILNPTHPMLGNVRFVLNDFVKLDYLKKMKAKHFVMKKNKLSDAKNVMSFDDMICRYGINGKIAKDDMLICAGGRGVGEFPADFIDVFRMQEMKAKHTVDSVFESKTGQLSATSSRSSSEDLLPQPVSSSAAAASLVYFPSSPSQRTACNSMELNLNEDAIDEANAPLGENSASCFSYLTTHSTKRKVDVAGFASSSSCSSSLSSSSSSSTIEQFETLVKEEEDENAQQRKKSKVASSYQLVQRLEEFAESDLKRFDGQKINSSLKSEIFREMGRLVQQYPEEVKAIGSSTFTILINLMKAFSLEPTDVSDELIKMDFFKVLVDQWLAQPSANTIYQVDIERFLQVVSKNYYSMIHQAFNWRLLGQTSERYDRCVIDVAVLNDTFAADDPKPAQQVLQRRRRVRKRTTEKKDEVKAKVVTNESENEDEATMSITNKRVRELREILPPKYAKKQVLDFVLDRASFSKTVENIFYLSFLIKKRDAVIEIVQEKGKLGQYVWRDERNENSKKLKDVERKNSYTVSLNHAKWKQLTEMTIASSSSSSSSSLFSNHWRRGAIVRVVLKDFMNAAYSVLDADEDVNLIIGPNGVGKSTFAAAICLCLGGTLNSVGRFEQISGFVRENCQSASIEVYLLNDDKVTDIRNLSRDRLIDRFCTKIECVITAQNCVAYKHNGEEIEQKDLCETLMIDFQIQMDNLCNYLAQDRVAAFPQKTTEQRLVEMQQAISPQLLDAHNTIVSFNSDEGKVLAALKAEETAHTQASEKLMKLKEKVEQLERVERMRSDLELLLKKRKWIEYQIAAENSERAKQDFLLATAAHHEEKMKIEQLSPLILAARKQWEKAKAGCEKSQNFIDELEHKVQVFANQASKKVAMSEQQQALQEKKARAESELQRLIGEEKTIEMQLFSRASPSSSSSENRRQRLEIIEKQLKQMDLEDIKRTEELQRLQQHMAKTEQELNGPQNPKQRIIHNMSRIFRDTPFRSIQQFLKRNSAQFKGPVYGPLLAEITITGKDDKETELICVIVENYLSTVTKLMYVVMCLDDQKLLQAYFIEKNICSAVTTIKTDAEPEERRNRPTISTDIQSLMNEGKFPELRFLDSLVSCPPRVMQALLDREKLSKVVFTFASLQPAQRKLLTNSIARLIDNTTIYRTSVSQYDPQDRQTDWTELQQHWNVLSTAILTMRKLTARLSEVRHQLDMISKIVAANDDSTEKLRAEAARLRATFASFDSERELKNLRLQMSQCQNNRRNVEETVVNFARREKELQAAYDDSVADEIHKTAELQNLQEKLKCESSAHELLKQKISQHQNDYDSLKSKETESKTALRGFEKDLDEKRKKYASAERLRREAERSEGDPVPFPEISSVRDCEQKEAELQAGIDSLSLLLFDIDVNAKSQYEKLEREIKEMKEKYEKDKRDYEEKVTETKQMGREWKRCIQGVINTVSKAFAQYFRAIGGEGEVKLQDGENDYSKYGLEIWVAFKKSAKLAILHPGYQSGGQKSVATMLFLLSLQEVTNVPFRIADEINQGMDSRYEEMIWNAVMHGRTAATATQMFIISPKLLPSLKLEQHVIVHTIFSTYLSQEQQQQHE